MTDWTNANYNISTRSLQTPNNGPENGFDEYVWRSVWPQEDNSLTWQYFLNYDKNTIGFIQNDPLKGNVGGQTGDEDVQYLVTNGWPSNIPFSGLSKPLPEMGTVLTHDNVIGGKHEDWLFPGPGNDRLEGQDAPDYLVGGAGNDLIFGGAHGDILYGDWNNAPVVLHKQDQNQVFTWEIPDKADPTVVPGNDQLNGGPRGQGWTDVLTGGGGADAFYLSYSDGNSSSGGGTFWSAVAEEYIPGIGGNAVQAGVDKLAEAAAKEFFAKAAGSFLLGGLDTAVGDLASEGLSLLLGMHKSATPQSGGDDVMVVTDFDPREDVLFLPVTTADQEHSATQLSSSAKYYTESSAGANGQTGYGIEFTKGDTDTVFAEVFLAQDFLDEFQITESSEFAIDFIRDLFSYSLVIDDQGVQESSHVYPFSTSPSAYADGVVPVVADTPIPFKAPSGTTTKVFGAYGALSALAPTSTDTGVYLAGTNQGDLLNVNPKPVGPTTVLDPTTLLTSDTSEVRGFGGNDIIFGGDGVDHIYGGDGDDWIYGIGNDKLGDPELFSGDDGNDLIYLGWTSMSANVDGGDGIDTASFLYVDGTVTADLSKITTDALHDPNANSTINVQNDPQISNYALNGIENLGGTSNADTLTGDSNDNIIQGNDGNDTLDGGGGTDTASYADDTGKVVVDLSKGTAEQYSISGTYTDSLTGFEGAIGSAYDDTITGNDSGGTFAGGAGNDTLDGGGGTNTLSYADNSGAVSIDIWTGSTNELGPHGGSNASTVVSTDSFENFNGFVGTPFGDEFRNGSAGGYVIDGGDGVDSLLWYDTDAGVTVDLASGIIADNGWGKQDTIGNVEDVDGTNFADSLTGDDNANRLRGFDGNDVLVGGDGDDHIITDDGMNKVTPGAGADTVVLAQSATEQADYQSNSVEGGVTDWAGDGIGRMGYKDFLTVTDWSKKASFSDESSTGLKVTLNSSSAFGIANPVFSTSDLVQQLSNGDLVLSYKSASLDSEAVAAHFTSPTPVTDGGDATALDDLVVGSTSDDTLNGLAGNDVLHGLDGSDGLLGGSGADGLFGGDGGDWLDGGSGNDILVSGAGIAEVATGGSGADTHVFGEELANGIRETDIIQDYDPLEDLIDLGGSEITRYVESANSVVLWAGADEDVIIVNGATSLASLVIVDGSEGSEAVA